LYEREEILIDHGAILRVATVTHHALTPEELVGVACRKLIEGEDVLQFILRESCLRREEESEEIIAWETRSRRGVRNLVRVFSHTIRIHDGVREALLGDLTLEYFLCDMVSCLRTACKTT
jgi:hypothetical protein